MPVSVQLIPKDEACLKIPDLRGGVFNGCDESPFGIGRGEGIDFGRNDPVWIVARNRPKYDITSIILLTESRESTRYSYLEY